MSIDVRKVADDHYEIAGAGHILRIDGERYEDIYFSIPEEAGKYKNETEFYRHLTDNICESQQDRDTINALLDAQPDKIEALRQIQDIVRRLGTN